MALCLIPVAVIAQGPAANTTPSPVQSILPWAYPVAPPNPPGTPAAAPAPDDGKPKRVPGSDVALTLPQIRDGYNPPDWYPTIIRPCPKPSPMDAVPKCAPAATALPTDRPTPWSPLPLAISADGGSKNVSATLRNRAWPRRLECWLSARAANDARSGRPQ